MSLIYFTIIPTLILLAGVVDDLRSRKVHNWLVLTLAAVALASTFWFAGWAGLQSGIFGMIVALVMTLPLVLGRILGAGDMKLLAVFGLACQWNAVASVLVLSIFWGAILGLMRAIVSGQAMTLIHSTLNVAMRRKPSEESLQRMPYSVALLFGWLTHLTLLRLPGGSLW